MRRIDRWRLWISYHDALCDRLSGHSGQQLNAKLWLRLWRRLRRQLRTPLKTHQPTP